MPWRARPEPAGSGAPVWGQPGLGDQVAAALPPDRAAGERGHRGASALEGATGARVVVGSDRGPARYHASGVGGAVVGRAGREGGHRDAVAVLHRRRDQLLKKSLAAAEQERPEIAQHRARWQRAQGRLDPRRLVFIDETWAKTNMTRSHGRCPRGQRLVATRPYGHWQPLTFVAALRHDRIVAPVSSMARSTACGSWPMWSNACSRPSPRAISSLWTISAATRARLCAGP